MRPFIRFEPDPVRLFGVLTNVPVFPGEFFVLSLPEGIGDVDHPSATAGLMPQWTDLGNGRWSNVAQIVGELSFTMVITPRYDTVDVDVSLTNQSSRVWSNSHAFHCFNCSHSASIADHECVRHWTRSCSQLRRLIELPRRFGPRPTIQVYNVEGAPPVSAIAVARNFDATASATLEGWLAIEARSGGKLVAIVSKPALYLFQNMEFSCIHSCPSFGALSPGETGFARTRMYLTRSTVPRWYRRMRVEMAAI